MAEYINREAALAICEEEYREQLRILNYAGDSVAWNIGHAIKELTAADVAPVVRCRDCKYLVRATVNSNGFLICHVNDMEIAPEDFCSYGERKEGVDNG